MNASFTVFFNEFATFPPHDWQSELASENNCDSRLIRIPTGLGKTEGVLAAWMWHRLERNDASWPRRLIWCLPMRVLVEQTAKKADAMIQAFKKANPDIDAKNLPEAHVLMGGFETEDWHLYPERPAVLIGTQDMLLSRALNRGYAAGRARWPIDYALLNHDALWIMDEVQLMDVGLITSVQLQAFRNQEAAADRMLRPAHTWWMSATLQADWLDTVDFGQELKSLREQMTAIPMTGRTGPLWEISKPLSLKSVPGKANDASSRMVSTILDAHESAETDGMGRVTLVIVNRVDTALELHKEVEKALNDLEPRPDVNLIHSRFRGMEREKWPGRFLSRSHCENPDTNMILIATQVIEAGVDISATALVTQLAPWPSLVQRFGRAARYGGTANVTVVDTEATGKDCLPYDETDLAASTEALALLQDVGIATLEAFEDSLRAEDPDLLNRLYRYEYIHLLTRGECDELFDTSPDLTGADIDVSRFIRSGDENDVQVCWFEAEKGVDRPPSKLQPVRAGLCPVPVHKAKDWVFKATRVTAWKAKEKRSHAWVWDYLEGSWHPARKEDLYPGRIVLVDAAFGGYDLTRGFNGEPPKKNSPSIPTEGAFKAAREADLAQDREDLSDSKALKNASEWKTIATHCQEVAAKTKQIASTLDLSKDLLQILHLAARLHDWGKSHPAFQSSIKNNPRFDTAKAPDWVGPSKLYCMDKSLGGRKGFRHEIASAIAVVELLARRNPHHEALLGPYSNLIELGVLTPTPPADLGQPCPLADELDDLDAAKFDLLVWLICAHHGKARGSWQATPQDQEFKAPLPGATESKQTQADDYLECADSSELSPSERPGEEKAGPKYRSSDTPDLPIRGICNGDTLPSILLPGSDGENVIVPELTLDLSLASLGLSDRYGRSWIERAQGLLKLHGPFALAWLEALLRAADVRSSKCDTDTDPLFNKAESES